MRALVVEADVCGALVAARGAMPENVVTTCTVGLPLMPRV